MKQEDKSRALGELLVKISLSTVLADVIDSLVHDAVRLAPLVGKTFKHEKKQNFNMLVEAARMTRIRAKIVASDSYVGDMVDDFCDDAEFIEKLIMLVVKHVGASGEKENQLINYIKTL